MARRRQIVETERQFVRYLLRPQWTDDLSEEDIKSGTDQSVSILQFIAITRSSNNLSRTTMNTEGTLMLDAILFLTKNDLKKTVEILEEITRNEIPDRSSVNILFTIKPVCISVCDGDVFFTVALIAIKNVILLQNEPHIITPVANILANLINPYWNASPFLIYALETVYSLLKHVHLSPESCSVLIVNLMTPNALGSSDRRIFEYAIKITDVIAKDWTTQFKEHWLRTLTSTDVWEPGHYQLAIHLVRHWPVSVKLPRVANLLHRISATLVQKMVGSAATKLLQLTLPYVTIQLWTAFINDLYSKKPTEIIAQRSFIRSTVQECVYLAVKRYGKDISKSTLYSEMEESYYALITLCSVQEGLVDVAQYKMRIKSALNSSDELIQYYCVKMLCHFNKKTYCINQWHFRMIEIYLENLVYATNNIYSGELVFFLSHVSVLSNNVIKQQNVLDKHLIMCGEFIDRLYDFCIENMKSRDQHRIFIGAQIFNLVQKVCTESSASLKIRYNLNKDDTYEKGGSPFLHYLQSVKKWRFGCTSTFTELVKEFLQSPKVFIDISQMLKKWCATNITPDAGELKRLFALSLTIMEHKVDRESIAKGRCIIELILENQYYHTKDCRTIIETVFERWLQAIKILQNNPVGNVDMTTPGIGFTYCIYDMLDNNNIYMIEEYRSLVKQIFDCCIVIISVLLRNYNVTQHTNKEKGPVITTTNTFVTKNTEQMIVICLNILALVLEKDISVASICAAVEIANEVILASCGRSPVATAATTIRKICCRIFSPSDDESIDSDRQQVVIIKFLERILYSIYTVSENQVSNIRRNPEHRLTIHSIVVADQLPNHPCLVRTMEFLLGVLSDPSLSGSSIAAALHTVEALVVDNTIRNSTFPFISSIAIHCINEFSSNDWKIKNATIQVLQALVNRILGPTCNALNRRHTTLEEIFILHPSLALYFHSKLENGYVKEECGSIIAILALFSESHTKLSVYLSRQVNFIISYFAQKFVNMICEDGSIVGLFAAKAYGVIYPHAYIPFIICDIVDWLRQNFYKISRNIFYSVACLLQSLYEKFNLTSNIFYYRAGLSIIQPKFESLLLFLEQFNDKFEFSLFCLLSIKSNGIQKSKMTVFGELEKCTYQSRLWLHNNVPYILCNMDIQQFPNFFTKCLNQPLSLSLLKHFLNSVVERYNELIEHSLNIHVLVVLISKFLQLLTDKRQYLVCSFSHIILLLFEGCDLLVTNDLILSLRSSYRDIDVSNVYILAVFVALLSRIKDYTNADRIFIKSVVATYKDVCLTEDVEVQMHIASSLIYLYECVEIPDRQHLFKIAFILLLNRETGSEICKFVAFSFNITFSSVYTTLRSLISIENLTKLLDSEVDAAAFLVDLAHFMSLLSDPFQDCGEFYMKQNSDICSHKYSVRRMLLEELKIAFEILSYKDCAKMLSNIG